ncbi:hypothetical protein HDU92_000115 [Lobulomyces angularis]|nr:hypothetical protein HDU92_000115 [Lobulomyces angularis]
MNNEFVEITDPQTGRLFYANIQTGECTWEKPIDRKVKLKNPDDSEWWELFDENHKLPYYYNTKTGETEWLRPSKGTVIPLISIQNSSIGKRVSVAIKRASTMNNFGTYHTNHPHEQNNDIIQLAEEDDAVYGTPPVSSSLNDLYGGPPKQNSNISHHHAPLQQQQRSFSEERSYQASSTSPRTSQKGRSSRVNKSSQPNSPNQISKSYSGSTSSISRGNAPSPSPMQFSTSLPVNTVFEEQPGRTSANSSSSPAKNKDNMSTSVGEMYGTYPGYSNNNASQARSMDELPSIPQFNHQQGQVNANATALANAKKHGISEPTMNPEAAIKMNPFALKKHNSLNETTAIRNQEVRLSLPTALKKNIENFRIDGFAKKYFSEHRRGIFRRRVPLEKMLHYQKDALKSPLLVLNKNVQKEALKCFKLIQKIMGDRSPGKNNVDDIRALADIGILRGELRDEIYVQVCKQLTENPDGGHYGNSVFRGWQLLCVLSVAFPPSKNLEDYMKSFITQNFDSSYPLKSSLIPPGTIKPLNVLARHLYRKMEKICKFGPRGKPMTNAEVERTMEAPFKVSIFGETLEEVMKCQIELEAQQKTGRNRDVPKIMPFLADAILNLNGCKTEGIFRVPGDADGVTDLRCRIEKGDYDLTGITDPNIPSSLLKLWLRELAEPLIPVESYDTCIKVGSSENDEESYVEAMNIINSLPEINRKVVEYMIRFLKIVGDPNNVKATKMTYQNIAMVFAPNFLRCPSDNPAIIFENTKFEQAFLRTLLQN